eukprot:6462999-Amphidinium_carterae.1
MHEKPAETTAALIQGLLDGQSWHYLPLAMKLFDDATRSGFYPSGLTKEGSEALVDVQSLPSRVQDCAIYAAFRDYATVRTFRVVGRSNSGQATRTGDRERPAVLSWLEQTGRAHVQIDPLSNSGILLQRSDKRFTSTTCSCTIYSHFQMHQGLPYSHSNHAHMQLIAQAAQVKPFCLEFNDTAQAALEKRVQTTLPHAVGDQQVYSSSGRSSCAGLKDACALLHRTSCWVALMDIPRRAKLKTYFRLL